MAPLAHTLALLAMAVATAANEVPTLDMARDSFDDQYRGCGPAMTAALPALNHSELQKNPHFAQFWAEGVADGQRKERTVSPLSPDQGTALMAFLMDSRHNMFNNAVRVAGRSPQEYRDNFHFKTLHFLLTQALGTLRDAREGQCLDVAHKDCNDQYRAQRGDTVRFGQFMLMFPSDTPECRGKETLFQVHTCHGAEIQQYITEHLQDKVVLIPPFETFLVTEVTQEGDKSQIQLRSSGTYSKYNCEWLKGGSVSLAPFHLTGLLLATTALAVATGIL